MADVQLEKRHITTMDIDILTSKLRTYYP